MLVAKGRADMRQPATMPIFCSDEVVAAYIHVTRCG